MVFFLVICLFVTGLLHTLLSFVFHLRWYLSLNSKSPPSVTLFIWVAPMHIRGMHVNKLCRKSFMRVYRSQTDKNCQETKSHQIEKNGRKNGSFATYFIHWNQKKMEKGVRGIYQW